MWSNLQADKLICVYISCFYIAAVRDEFQPLELKHGARLEANTAERLQTKLAQLDSGTHRKWPRAIPVIWLSANIPLNTNKCLCTAHSCSICKVLCYSNKMDWLSTSAEHMNSHAMHFPCLKANVTSNSNSNSNSNGLSNNLNNNNNNSVNSNSSNNNNNNNNEVNNNRVLACKDCISYLTSQWESMDAERVPLEHRRFYRMIIIICQFHLMRYSCLADTTFPRPWWRLVRQTDLAMAPWVPARRLLRHLSPLQRPPAPQFTVSCVVCTQI